MVIIGFNVVSELFPHTMVRYVKLVQRRESKKVSWKKCLNIIICPKKYGLNIGNLFELFELLFIWNFQFNPSSRQTQDFYSFLFFESSVVQSGTWQNIQIDLFPSIDHIIVGFARIRFNLFIYNQSYTWDKHVCKYVCLP